ncbi:hypothetical protein H8S10_00975 [Clostridium sp. NSJ-49]|uniref:hypothetical protein n=1 Tax=Clostridium TaxID=1485 RepID=UPI00164C897A|nr:hypothetical protein [Clostridium sp. NSJ-49]MBC5624032.1 hypothetical protein [Clostridium sp. NSJ-49]
MKNLIKIKRIEVKNNRIEYFLEVFGYVKKFFVNNENMYVQYQDSIEDIPFGIAVIPLLSNILPIAWFSDAEIIIGELDKTFYNAIDNIKEGYSKMHPNANLGGKISVKNIIDYSYEPSDKCATFFSGGVDSLGTLIEIIDEKPILVTLWGSDISLDDKQGWDKVKREVVDFGNKRNLQNLLIESSFRRFISEGELTKAYSKFMKDNDNWWHGAQHGIGLIGHVAPYAYKNKLKIIYIPASLSPETINFSCASHPTIDNEFKFAGCSTVHHGFENNRQNKISIISDYIKESDDKLFIRVCWQSDGGINCSKCEKCSRTIMGLIANKINPNEHGFYIDKNTSKEIESNMKYNWILSESLIEFWNQIKNKFNKDKELWKKEESVNWILNINFNNLNRKKIINKKIKQLIIQIKVTLYKVLKR